ncbi:MAG: TIGR02757 family protein [Treponema sp.]|nr:TIGR02757 family protein [Treponema sp.]
MTEKLKTKLQALAEKYENTDFLLSDPSQFLRYYRNQRDAEPAAFTAALLSFGNRSLFIPKIRQIFQTADKSGGFAKWIEIGAFENDFKSPDGNEQKKFYRFYSYQDMKVLFRRLAGILQGGQTFGGYLQEKFSSAGCGNDSSLWQIISESFPDCAIVPKGRNSPNKRIHMYLRWMVRRNSPVDCGWWTWYSPSKLVIPLDTHVLQEAKKLGLIPQNAAASLKTALMITEELRQIWPEDPCKGDFALFGLGVDPEKQ